jgi:hypothetical protein
VRHKSAKFELRLDLEMCRIAQSVVVLAAVLHSVATVSWAQTAHGPFRVQWERHFGGQRLPYTHVAAAFSSKQQNLILCVRSDGVGDRPRVPMFQIWWVDKDGNLVQQIPVPDRANGSPLGLEVPVRPSMVALESGEILLVLKSESDQTLLLRVDEKGGLILARDLLLPPDVVISRITCGKDNNFLLVGSDGDNGFAARIDLQGNVIWHRSFDRGQIESFTSAIPSEGGGWFLVGSSSPAERFHDPIVSEVWLLKCDASGRKESERVFWGFLPAACSGEDGGLAVVYYGTNASSSIELKLQVFDSGLRDLWSKSVSPITFVMLPFQIGRAPTKSFILAGAKPPKFWMVGLDRRGEEIWSFHDTRQSVAAVTCLDLIVSRDSAFAVTSVLSIENSRNPTGLLGIIKFLP